MDRAARLLRGTLRVRVESAFPERVLNLCGAHGIAFSDLRWESASALSFTVRAAERKKLERLLAPLDAALTIERAAGAPFFLRRFRRRYTLLAGLAFMLALFFANSFFIWDFEVSGSETVPAEKILRVLEKQGLRRGSFAYSFRPQDICNRALPELPELAWLTVNVRGCRAYVSVRDRVPKPELADDRTPTNVVAKRDALVTEVRAYDGRAMVRKGGTVTAGQLLISGAVQTEGPERPNVPSRLLAGRGQVRGRTWYELSIRVPLQYEEKRYTDDEKHSYALLLGERRVKFGAKGSSNLQGSCDKIIHQTKLSLPGGMALPLTWEETTLRPYETRTVTRTRTEAEELGARTLSAYLLTRIDGAVTATRVASAVQGGLAARHALGGMHGADRRDRAHLTVERIFLRRCRRKLIEKERTSFFYGTAHQH